MAPPAAAKTNSVSTPFPSVMPFEDESKLTLFAERCLPSFIHPRPGPRRHITGFLFRRGHTGHTITLSSARSHRQAARSQRRRAPWFSFPSPFSPSSPQPSLSNEQPAFSRLRDTITIAIILDLSRRVIGMGLGACRRFAATARRDTSPIAERASERP